MSLSDLSAWFEERLQEIETYLDLLATLQAQVQLGTPRIGGDGPLVTPQQQKILHSSVYLQLYNLVEATVTRCLDAITDAAAGGGRRPHELCLTLRREWVRHSARTHVDLNYDNRLESALVLCDRLIQSLPIGKFKIERGGGGNWDDTEIEEFTEKRLGLSLRFSKDTLRLAKQRKRNDKKGALQLVKSLRNDLAHGSLSFAECGADVTVSDLRELKDATAAYLRELVAQFTAYIESYEFLLPECRPAGGPA